MQNYQWNRRLRLPVAIDCICDVVFEGNTPITKEAIDLLIKYLELTRDTVPSQADLEARSQVNPE